MLSKRLKAVADMVTRDKIVADIGTDHGYVPIYLVKNNICNKVYAMDINAGPLKIADKNISQEGLEKNITTVLSDGMNQLSDYMAETVIIAGMGGNLIVDILSKGEKIKGVEELILSPHKRVDLVRKYLNRNHWKIIQEDMVADAGKYYTIIKAHRGDDSEYTDVEFIYGKYLLESQNKILKKYLEKENEKFLNILNTMKASGNKNTLQVNDILKINREGRAYYD